MSNVKEVMRNALKQKQQTKKEPISKSFNNVIGKKKSKAPNLDKVKFG